jgi:histidinol-phosphate aminotransferase
MPELWRFVLPSNLLPRKAVLDMAPYHPPSGGRRNKLRLDFNENTVGASPLVIDFIKRYLTASDLSIYPEYQNALEDLSRHFGVQETELTLTNGTDEAIQLLVNTFVDDNDEVLVGRANQ